MCLPLLVLLLRCAFTQRPTSGRSTTCDFASCCALGGTIVRTRLVLCARRFRAWLRSSGFRRWRLPVHSESRYSLPALQKRALRRNPVFDFLRVLRLERAALCEFLCVFVTKCTGQWRWIPTCSFRSSSSRSCSNVFFSPIPPIGLSSKPCDPC